MVAGKRFYPRIVICISALVLDLSPSFRSLFVHAGCELTMGIHPYTPKTESSEWFFSLTRFVVREVGKKIGTVISMNCANKSNGYEFDLLSIMLAKP